MKRPFLAGFLPLFFVPALSMAATPASRSATDDAGAARFLAALAQHCGQAFAGRVVADRPAGAAPDPFQDKTLVMHVRGCEAPERELRVPFHVGEDRSRTWVVTRVGDRLRLKHDHRHADGSPDKVTLYGGDAHDAGTAQRQEFPVDAGSVAMFEREGMAGSVRNIWAMEVEPGRRFLYELSRPDGRLFQVEFDLAHPVDLPPPPWGADAAATEKGA